MITKEALLTFCKCLKIEENRFSCLFRAITDARILNGRDPITGKYKGHILGCEKNNLYLGPNSFIGLISYLLILDMIGEIFRLKTEKKSKKSKIYLALNQFANGLREKDIYTIVALRNSLAHNYGLVNIPDNREHYENSRHKFSLMNFENESLIEYPTKKWEGNFSDKEIESSTIISVPKLIEQIESVYSELIFQIESNNVSLNLSDKEELYSRFTVRH